MKKVLIAGFGDTGVLVAAHLKGDYEITAITTKPVRVSGQELGSRLSRLDEWKTNYLMPFDKLPALAKVNIIQGQVTAINPDGQTAAIAKADGSSINMDYDALVIASGTRNGFWRTDQMQSIDEIERELASHAETLKAAKTIAIIGGGPTGVSTASNLKEIYPGKNVDLFISQDRPLTGYHDKTREFVTERLAEQGVTIHTGHRAKLPSGPPLPVLESGNVSFASGQSDFAADSILWAIGELQPNNSFIPKPLLNSDGFVRVNPYFQTSEHENIFAIGDIAATDPNRSSARNAGFQLAARNIDEFLAGKPKSMKAFKAPKHRWGSVLGIQHEGLRLFTPKGGTIRIKPWGVRNIIYPIFVDRMIYRGIDRE